MLFRSDCSWHEEAPPIDAIDAGWDTPFEVVWREGERALGAVDAIEFGREIVDELACVACHRRRSILRPIDAVSESEAVDEVIARTVKAYGSLVGSPDEDTKLIAWLSSRYGKSSPFRN